MKALDENARYKGFTLVEVMIVVAIIGLLSVVAIPSFAKARREARIDRMVNDLRIVYDAFNLYAMANGTYPSGVAYGDFTPQPVADYLDGARWGEPTVLGGQWLYVSYTSHGTYLLLIDNFNFGGASQPLAPPEYWEKIDSAIDDGDLSQGRFRFVGGVQMQYSLNEVDW